MVYGLLVENDYASVIRPLAVKVYEGIVKAEDEDIAIVKKGKSRREYWNTPI